MNAVRCALSNRYSSPPFVVRAAKPTSPVRSVHLATLPHLAYVLAVVSAGSPAVPPEIELNDPSSSYAYAIRGTTPPAYVTVSNFPHVYKSA